MRPHLNLLPTSLRVRAVLRSRVRLWSRLTLAAACGALLLAYRPWAESLQQQRLLHQCDLQASRLARMKAEAARMKKRLAADRTLQAAIAACQDDQLALRTMGVVGQVVRQPDLKVRMREIEFLRLQTSSNPSDPKAPPVETLSIRLIGLTSDQLAITTFVTRLRDTGIFDTIEAKPTGAQGTTSQLQHAFHIDGTLLRPRHVVAQGR
jgi:hypothetical protein